MVDQQQTLAGKVAIVTGGTRGIGAATVLELAKRGAKGVITYVQDSSTSIAENLIATIRALNNGSDAIAVQADVTAPDSPDKVVKASIAAFGETIDILVNNAGIVGATPMSPNMEQLAPTDPVEEYDRIMNINLRSVFTFTRAVIPHLPKSSGDGGGGRIINVGSAVARESVRTQAGAYAASKAGVEALGRVCAVELGADGHTVNTVAPGPTETDLTAMGRLVPGVARDFDEMAERTPLGRRLGTPEEVALVIAAVAEPQMGWVTGQTISASGGFSMV